VGTRQNFSLGESGKGRHCKTKDNATKKGVLRKKWRKDDTTASETKTKKWSKGVPTRRIPCAVTKGGEKDRS